VTRGAESVARPPATERHVVCPRDELPPGERRIVTVDRISIGVFNVDGSYYAVRNICPHRGAELCKGDVTGAMLPSAPGEFIYGMENRILKCPWHRWEFDLHTGRSLLDPDGCRVRTYPVHVEGDVIEIEVQSRRG
jgi:3-phenylpropionate/trans-cinnamate dioxygenase ferredoxin subunit